MELNQAVRVTSPAHNLIDTFGYIVKLHGTQEVTIEYYDPIFRWVTVGTNEVTPLPYFWPETSLDHEQE